MMRLRRIVHRRRSSAGASSAGNPSVVTLQVPRDDLQHLTHDAGVAPRKTGVLLKYTNVVKRWKHRIFVLENGVLTYGSPEDSDSDDSSGDHGADGPPSIRRKKKKLRFLRRASSKDEKERDIKGTINLQFAVVSPDDADPQKFAIDAGHEVYHIKASTEAERDEWVVALTASNEYFRGLIRKAVSRAKETNVANENSVAVKETSKVETEDSTKSQNAAVRLPQLDVSEGSEDTVLEDDGLREAEQTRMALMAELRRVHGLWGAKWFGTGTVPLNEREFISSIADAFVDTHAPPLDANEAVQATAKGLIELVSWCLHVMQTNDDMFERRLKADITRLMASGLPVFPMSPPKEVRQLGTSAGRSESSDQDSESEFFDALSRAASSRAPTIRLDSALDSDPMFGASYSFEEERENTEAPIAARSEVKRVDTQIISKGFKTRRTALPSLDGPQEKTNVFAILKDSVGKDLSKITFPIGLNEPISFLQRLAEDIEYCELLDRGAVESDPERRLMYAATMVISHLSSTQGRVGKPFNPILGETSCVIMPDKGKGVRYIAEQVSHHPPVSACYAEGSGASWKYHNAIEIKNKFWGKSLEVFPTGLNHIEFPAYGDHYVFEQVTTCVHNIVIGRMWVDNYGEMEIVNKTNGGKCVINFSKTGWMSDAKSFGSIKATIYDAAGKAKIKLGGNWTKCVYEELPNGKKNILWTVAARPEEGESQSYNMTKWAISLNAEVADDERPFVAPTDSRLRPDQRALENGQYARGQSLKHAIEEGQRARRKQREEAGEEWEPRWFKKIPDSGNGVTDYQFGDEFFQKQAIGDWARCPDLFSCAMDAYS